MVDCECGEVVRCIWLENYVKDILEQHVTAYFVCRTPYLKNVVSCQKVRNKSEAVRAAT